MTVSVEVVDGVTGLPAEGVRVTLRREDEEAEPEPQETDISGSARWHDAMGKPGRYRLTFDLDEYFAGVGVASFQSCVQLVFRHFQEEAGLHCLLVVTPTAVVSVLNVAV